MRTSTAEVLPRAVEALRRLAAITAAAAVLGLLIGGVFNRLAMMLLAALNPAATGVESDDGLPLWIPGDVRGRCCATPWYSKGYRAGAEHMAGETREALERWSDGGRLPVVVDATSCTQGLLEAGAGVEVIDSVAWAHDRLLPALRISRRLRSIAVHPTCASRWRPRGASARSSAGRGPRCGPGARAARWPPRCAAS